MCTSRFLLIPLMLVSVLSACSRSAPLAPEESAPLPTLAAAWGPETPPFNLEVILRDPAGGRGFGLVKFRQVNDDRMIITLDTWVRDLVPLTPYRLQRAVDTTLDGVCTSSAWLTLGAGLTPLAIVTDEHGTGRAALWRDVGAFPVGSTFDIHFRIIDDASGAVALTSDCYRFVTSQ